MKKRSWMGGALLGALIGTAVFSSVEAKGGAHAAPRQPGLNPSGLNTLADQNLRSLTQEARLLTVQASLKPEDRPAFQKLMADRRALGRAMQGARQNRLVAYIQALKSGQSVQQARASARKAEQGTPGLKTQAGQVRQEAQALAKKYPKLAHLLLTKTHHHKAGMHKHKKGKMNRGRGTGQGAQNPGQAGPHPRMHRKGAPAQGASGTSGDSSGQ